MSTTKISMSGKRLSTALYLLLTALLGLGAVILPVFILPDIRMYESPLFSIVRTGIEGLNYLSIILLIFSGFIVRLISSKKSWLIGLFTMASFPILALIEMVIDPKSHNLFPLEFLMYGFISVFGIVGAYLGQGIQSVLKKLL